MDRPSSPPEEVDEVLPPPRLLMTKVNGTIIAITTTTSTPINSGDMPPEEVEPDVTENAVWAAPPVVASYAVTA